MTSKVMSALAKKRWAKVNKEERSEYARNMALQRHKKAGHKLSKGYL